MALEQILWLGMGWDAKRKASSDGKTQKLVISKRNISFTISNILVNNNFYPYHCAQEIGLTTPFKLFLIYLTDPSIGHDHFSVLLFSIFSMALAINSSLQYQNYF